MVRDRFPGDPQSRSIHSSINRTLIVPGYSSATEIGFEHRKQTLMERNRHSLHSNRSRYCRVRVVPGDFKILNPIVVDTFGSPEQVQFRKRPRFAS